jgi:glycosyltransferase involved in cell wall biosynthesis
MRVLMVTNTYAPARNGVAMWVALSVRELRARGHEVEVLTYRHARREPGDPGIHEAPAAFGIDPDFRVSLFPPSLPETLTDRTWDVVHVHHPILLGPAGVRLAKDRGAKVCATFHSLYSDYFDEYYWGLGRPLKARFDARVERFANSCDVVFAPSSRVERWLRERDVTASVVRVEPPADGSRIQPCSRAAARARLALDERPIAFYVGRVADEKRVGVLVDEFASARDAMPDGAMLVIGGSGRRLPDVQRQIRRLGLADCVRTLGPVAVEDLGLWYSAADVCTSASRSETGPLTVVEAMSCGCPCVALQAPGFEDRITDGDDGVLVPDEPGRLGAGIAAVLGDRALRERLAAGARLASLGRTASATTEHLLSVYRGLQD